MDLNELAEITKAQVLFEPQDKEIDIEHAGASDLMSDVLAFLSEMPLSKDLLLITGLVNLQTIRTASLVEIPAIMFTRGKVPHEAILENARENNIAVLTTDFTSYTVCGLLYSAGLMGIDDEIKKEDTD